MRCSTVCAGRGQPRRLVLILRGLLLLSLITLASGCMPLQTPTGGDGSQQQNGAEGHWWERMPSVSSVELEPGERLRVVATTSIVADVVRRVGGDQVTLSTLVPLGADPHAFEPTPQDAVALAEAHVVFAGGAGLEVFLADLLETVGNEVPVVPVSYGLDLLRFEDEDAAHESDSHEEHDEYDPHTWFDPTNVIGWTHNIEEALSTLDPEHAADYAANGAAYREQLQALDAWIQDQVARLPTNRRRLVTDHAVLAYFARRYGFEQVGSVLPGFSTLAEPSAGDLAALEDVVRAAGVSAIFVGATANPDLADRVAQDTGISVALLYTGSLSEPGGPAGDYVSFMRHNVAAMVQALR